MYIWKAIPELEEATGLDKPQLSKYMTRVNLVLIKKAPLEYLAELARALPLYWFPFSPKPSNLIMEIDLIFLTMSGSMLNSFSNSELFWRSLKASQSYGA